MRFLHCRPRPDDLCSKKDAPDSGARLILLFRTVAQLDQHPSLLVPEHRRIRRRLLVLALLGLAWSLGVFLFSLHPPGFVKPFTGPHFHAGIIYSWYGCLLNCNVIVSITLSHFLASRGWLRTAACVSMVPGPGLLFSLPQMIPAWWIYRRLGDPVWLHFFEWRHRANPVNDLTERRDGKLLHYQ